MYDDKIIDLACAIIGDAVKDYTAPLPTCKNGKFKAYQAAVDKWLKNRISAKRFFKSGWFGLLSLGRDGYEVMKYYDEKGVIHNVNN